VGFMHSPIITTGPPVSITTSFVLPLSIVFIIVKLDCPARLS